VAPSPKRPRLWLFTPHPSRPGSMVTFVALPAFMILLTLVWVVASLFPVRPFVPGLFDTEAPSTSGQEESGRLRKLAEGLASGTADERGQKILALARETERCPGYAPYSVPRLAGALKDPDARVRAATAFALGALGPHASAALPSLREAQGKGDVHLDHVLSEAIWWIQHGDASPPDGECFPLPVRPASQAP
jgi:HEAT repeats